jgi:Spy/CpxP family protein refolding chaperone
MRLSLLVTASLLATLAATLQASAQTSRQPNWPDIEDGPRGFGAHSDQERVLESELHRFVRLNWEIVSSLARASSVTVP